MIARDEAKRDRVCMTPTGCDRCGRDFRSYMVLDDVWCREAGMLEYGSLLCLPCLQERIGRQLTLVDFPDYPVNDWVQVSL